MDGSERERPRVAFVNGGILGLSVYATWLRRTFPDSREIVGEHLVLTEGLTRTERVIRRAICQRVWPDPGGYVNLDLARFRRELHAGLQARRRLLARGLQRFDVLHFHRQATAYASLDLMDRLPSIVSIDCTQSCVLQDLHSRLERWSLGFNVRRDGEVFARAAAIVSTSRWAESDLRRAYPECDRPVYVLSPPVMLDAFDATTWIDERMTRAATGSLPQLLFIGGDFPRKGGYDLLEAWTTAGFHGRAELTLVTDWPLPDRLPPGVRVARGVSAYSPMWTTQWRSADMFVMPTHNEAFGLVYQEAAAAGLPAVGSDLNAVPEIIDHGATGFLVRPRDRADLIQALERLIGSAHLRREMGRAARAAIEQRGNPEIHRQRLLDVIHAVRRTGPPVRRRMS